MRVEPVGLDWGEICRTSEPSVGVSLCTCTTWNVAALEENARPTGLSGPVFSVSMDGTLRR